MININNYISLGCRDVGLRSDDRGSFYIYYPVYSSILDTYLNSQYTFIDELLHGITGLDSIRVYGYIGDGDEGDERMYGWTGECYLFADLLERIRGSL